MGRDVENRDPIGGSAKTFSSTAINTFVGILGVIIPVVGWAVTKSDVRDVLFYAETFLLLFVVFRYAWLQRSYIHLRRVNAKTMADAAYFELIRSKLEAEAVEDLNQVSDGHLLLFAAEVPRVSVLLVRTLIESSSEPRRILAPDLTANPQLLLKRKQYLAINRKFIETRGVILRIFICRLSDLARKAFAKSLLELIEEHRTIGVQCGLAVRDLLDANHTIDFVVIAAAAVLVEEEQGDSHYNLGRSSVYFKHIDKWIDRFDEIWHGHDSHAAPLILKSYEDAVRPMLGDGRWSIPAIRKSLLVSE